MIRNTGHTLYGAFRRLVPYPLTARIKRLLEPVTGFDRKVYYSQFGEDAFLQSYFLGKEWRPDLGPSPFKRKPRPGFYIDVGAYAPIENSNTYWFYRRGWQGINIDPTPGTADVFSAVRRRDINLELAVSVHPGEQHFFAWGTPSVYNTLSETTAREYAERVGRAPRELMVPTRTLASILEEHLPPGQRISFLSVDVEGRDLDVLQSNDWESFRPELVLAEDHPESGDDAVASPITRYLEGVGYRLFAWIGPTLVFRTGTPREGPR
jgi:FkbM family methyltransferase